MSVNFNVRLNSIESNVSSLQSTLEEGLKNLSKQIEKNTNSTELFNHHYFLLPQSDNPDERLLDDAHAEIIIDGITDLYLRTKDRKSAIFHHLKEFPNLIACRWYN